MSSELEGTHGRVFYDRHVHPDDLQLFNSQDRYGDHVKYSFFKYVGEEEAYLIVQRGEIRIRVRPEGWVHLRRFPFEIGERVQVKDDPTINAVVRNIGWHYKREKEIYLLVKNGKKSKRWYWREELDVCD